MGASGASAGGRFFLLHSFMWLWVRTHGIPLWGRCTTRFRTYFSGDLDVNSGYGILTHGHVPGGRMESKTESIVKPCRF